MRLRTLILLTAMIISQFGFSSCNKEENTDNPTMDESDYKQFSSAKDLLNQFETIAALTDSLERETRMNNLWDSLKQNRQIPFTIGDTALFLYKSNATEIRFAGDFNGWNPSTDDWKAKLLPNTSIWYLEKSFPSNARLDYKIVVNNNWILDPNNSYRQYSGFGPNSELRMPEWQFPEETILGENVQRGKLEEKQLIASSIQNLGYEVAFKVYKPYGYENLTAMPVVYVTDGHEYADDRLGAMLIVLDNLIHEGKIEPVLAVFVDPRDPNSGNNRRMQEYSANSKFVNFLADELVPFIDENYNSIQQASKRMILGTSLGGWCAAFTGLQRSDRFGLLGIHSPAFDQQILNAYQQSEPLPLKIFMSTGTIFDTQERASAMKQIMDEKAYPLLYIEVNEGHSWGNWRALLDEPLQWFFGK